MGALLFSHIRVTNVKLINEKNSLNITVWMFAKPQRLILLLRFLRTSHKSLSWGWPGMSKSSSGMDVVSNRWKSIISSFRDYSPIGFRDIYIQKFWNVTSSYLQQWASSQILTFFSLLILLPVFIDMLTWTLVNT